MEACRPILKRINVRSVERSGYILAHECSSPDSSEIKNKLFIIEKEMTKRFRENEYRRDCYVESFTNELVAVNPFASHRHQTWFRGFVLDQIRSQSDIRLKVQLIDYSYHELIPLDDVRPLPKDFSTSVLECQGMKIVLYGVEPAFLKLDLANENKLSGNMQFFDKDKKFISKQLEEAEAIYFKEICRSEEFYFGEIFLKQIDGMVSSLQELLLKSDNALECSDFKSKIPEYISNFRRNQSAFDHDLTVRKILYPTISFSDVERPISARNRSDSTPFDDNSSASNMVPETTGNNISRSSLSESAHSNISRGTFPSISSSDEPRSPPTVPNNPTIEIIETENECSRLIDKVLIIYGDPNNRFKAVSSFNESTLDSETFQMLKRLQLRDMSLCQKYVIPAILSGQNVTLIDGSTAGKTVGVLIALISLMRQSKEKQTGLGARAVVVCPSSSKCEQVQECCRQIIQGRRHSGDPSGDPVSVNVAYGLGVQLERKNTIELAKGHDILACTPKRLLRLLENEVTFDFKRLSLIVFDDMNILLNSYKDEITQILAHVRRKPKLPQRIIISNNWIPTMKFFIQEDIQHGRGSLLIPSHLDAALFVHLKSVWRYIADERKKLDNIIGLLKGDIKARNVVVVFKDEDDIDLIHSVINKRCASRSIHITGGEFRRDLDAETAKTWQSEVIEGRHPILFCTDYSLSDLHIYEADCLVHYSLPKSKAKFLFRFSVLLHRLQCIADESIRKKPDGKSIHPLRRPEMYIYSSAENVKQFPAIIEIMDQLGAQIPDDLKESAQNELRINEMLRKGSDICPDLCEFGRCSAFDASRCKFRHVVLPEDTPAENIPSNGYIKIHLVHVFSATHYGVRILGKASESPCSTSGSPGSCWSPVKESGPMDIKLKIHFSDKKNKKLCVENKVGDIAAIERDGVFHRVKIVKFLLARTAEVDEKFNYPKRALVKFIDQGWQEDISTVSLIQLPTWLSSIPPAILDVFVCNLLPVDEDIAWGDQITSLVREKLKEYQDDKMCSFFGKVELVLGRNLWLDSLKCARATAAYKKPIPVFSVSKMLLDEQMAIHHEHHLRLLLKKRHDAGLRSVDPLVANPPVASVFRNQNEVAQVSNGGEILSRDEKVFLKPSSVASIGRSVSRSALKPLVEWRQDSARVFVTVAVNSENFEIKPTRRKRKTRLYFCASIDDKFYEFNEVLFSTVTTSSIEARKSGVSICIKMTKLLKGIKWKQLFRSRVPCKWVRKDQNFIDSSDDDSYSGSRSKSTNMPVFNRPDSCLRRIVCRDPAEFDKGSNSDFDSAGDISDTSVRGFDSD